MKTIPLDPQPRDGCGVAMLPGDFDRYRFHAIEEGGGRNAQMWEAPSADAVAAKDESGIWVWRVPVPV